MSLIPRLHLPMRKPEDVIPFLGKEEHWEDDHSAKLIATTWFSANDLPLMVRRTLEQIPRFADAELVDAFLERCVELGDGLRPSQTDVLAVLGLKSELAVMAVEGKVTESFGSLVSEWLRDASNEKHQRLARLAKTLGLDVTTIGHLRYQLLHRTASAIYEAHRYHAKAAIMMVHSFDPADAGVADFKRFSSQMRLSDADATRLIGPVECERVDLYLGWTADRPSNEGFSIVNGRKTDESFYESS
jgi:hypothetical protein